MQDRLPGKERKKSLLILYIQLYTQHCGALAHDNERVLLTSCLPSVGEDRGEAALLLLAVVSISWREFLLDSMPAF